MEAGNPSLLNRFGSDPFVNPNLTAIGLRTFGLETIIEFPLMFALAAINFLFRPEILKFVNLLYTGHAYSGRLSKQTLSIRTDGIAVIVS